jgi:hypothetical protein
LFGVHASDQARGEQQGKCSADDFVDVFSAGLSCHCRYHFLLSGRRSVVTGRASTNVWAAIISSGVILALVTFAQVWSTRYRVRDGRGHRVLMMWQLLSFE